METIADELIETSKDYINDIVKIVYDEKFNFLFVNTDSQKMFKNWDEIIIDE